MVSGRLFQEPLGAIRLFPAIFAACRCAAPARDRIDAVQGLGSRTHHQSTRMRDPPQDMICGVDSTRFHTKRIDPSGSDLLANIPKEDDLLGEDLTRPSMYDLITATGYSRENDWQSQSQAKLSSTAWLWLEESEAKAPSQAQAKPSQANISQGRITLFEEIICGPPRFQKIRLPGNE
ncbi:hypothetical protein B0H12DRAFT_1070842 [Mycena haematopus]|nr:hypothetical protein B0H12DRAFT_1070842 [Mycena haematopus]